MKTYHGTRTIIIGMIILIHLSCTKEKEGYIKGRILEYGSNKPLEGVKVMVNVLSAPSYEDSVFTGADGRFNLPFPEVIGGNRLYFSKDKYITREAQEGLISGRPNDIGDKYLDPKSWINVHIVNDPAINADEIFASFISVNWHSGSDLYKLKEVQGNRFYTYAYSLKFGNITSTIVDSIFLPPFDTTNFQIAY